MGAPKATHCRFCGGGADVAEIVRGAHRKCYVAHYVRLAQEKRGPKTCNRCGVVIPSGEKLCGPHKIEARREVQARYNAKRNATMLCACGCGQPRGYKCGKYAEGHAPTRSERYDRKTETLKQRARRAKYRIKRPRLCMCGCGENIPEGSKRRIIEGHAAPMLVSQASKQAVVERVVNPRGVEPRRIPPVGAAGWSVSDARRFG